MNKDQLHDLILDFLDGKLDPQMLERLSEELESMGYNLENINELKLLVHTMDEIQVPEASPRMSEKFYQMLDSEIEKAESTRNNLSVIHWAENLIAQIFVPKFTYGLLLLLIGWVIGFWVTPNSKTDRQISQMNNEMQQMKEMVIYSMLNQPMASERLQALNLIEASSTDNSRIVESLLKALNSDPDVNVRMAAVEALLAYANQDQVRKELKESVLQQNSPLVQLTLIDGLVAINDKTAIPLLKSLINDNNINQEVRNRSRESITKLT